MTHSLSENSWVGDETDHLTGYDESWRLDEPSALDDEDDWDDDDDWDDEEDAVVEQR